MTRARLKSGRHPSQRCDDPIVATLPWHDGLLSQDWVAKLVKDKRGKPQSMLQSLMRSFAELRMIPVQRGDLETC